MLSHVCLANQAGGVTRIVKSLPHRGHALIQLGPERPGPVLARILSRNDGGPGRGAGRVRTISPVKEHTPGGKTIQIRGFNRRADRTKRISVLLLDCNQEYMFRHEGTKLNDFGRWFNNSRTITGPEFRTPE